MLSLSQSKHRNAVGRAHINLAVGNHGCNELVAGAKLVPPSGRLVAVVKFVGKIVGVVGVQHRNPTVLGCPQDAVAAAARSKRRAPTTLRAQCIEVKQFLVAGC
jgi:hypothetical protein